MKLKFDSADIPQILRAKVKRNSEIEVIFQQYYLVQYFLGKGKFAEVYCVQDMRQKTNLAMKIVDYRRIRKNQLEFKANKIIQLIDRQEELLRKVNSPFVIKVSQSFQNAQCKIILIQYCNEVTLLTYLRTCEWCMSQDEAITILKQICLGTYQLHKHNIIHRDLKLQNVMRKDGCYKIIDLGFSKQISDLQQSQNHTIVGTAYTMAPEITMCLPYGYKVDIYAIGVIFLKLITNNYSFDDRTPYNFLKNPSSFKNISSKPFAPEVIDFLMRTLESQEEKRIGWLQLVNHEIFKLSLAKIEPKFEDLINENLYVMRNQLKKQNLAVILQDQTNYQYKSEILVDEQKLKSNSQAEKLLVLQIKKGEYIMKQILQRMQRDNQKRFGIDKKPFCKLMCLLYQRAYLNLKVIREGSLKGYFSQDIELNIYRLQNSARQKHLFYLRKMSRSFSSRIFEVASTILKPLVNKQTKGIQSQILNGDQNQNFTKQQHINFTQKCIQQVISIIFCKSVSIRLLTYSIIMSLQVEVSGFEQKVRQIIAKF